MNKITVIILISSIVLLAIFLPKSCNEVPLVDNSQFKEKLEKLKSELIVLKASNDTLTKKYKEAKGHKNSVLYRTKLAYITIYDTIKCLPEVYVDSLIVAYEDVIVKADSVITIKDSLILNLSTSNDIKDTIIVNYVNNEKVLHKEIKKQKKRKWLFGLSGIGVGYLIGKIF